MYLRRLRIVHLTGGKQVTITVCLLLALQAGSSWAQSQPPTRSEQDYVRAESLVRGHHWDEGLDVLNRLLMSEPGNMKALNLAGIACAAKGDSQQADRYFERALTLDPQFLPALKNLSISEFNAHRYAAAEKHLLAAQQQLPQDPIINLYLGEIAYNQRDYSLAAERLGAAGPVVRHDPKMTALFAVSLLRSGQKQQALDLLSQMKPADLDPYAQLTAGAALAEAEQNELAIPYLAEAFAQDSDSYNTGFDLALVSVRARQYATAIAAMQKLIERNHDTSELENLLADALNDNGESVKALDAYRHAIALDPADESNYVDFASLCIDHRAFEQGMQVIAAGLRVHPASERLIFMRGVLEALQDNFDLAEEDFQRAALFDPRHDLGAVGLGSVYLERGQSAEAIKVTRTQLRQKPNDASLLFLLGKGLIASGAAPGQPAYAEAQQSLEKSVKLNPALCEPHIALGSIYMREERYADAVVQLEAARAIDPSENSAYSHLAVAYRHLGQPGKTKEVLLALQALLAQQRAGIRMPGETPGKEESKSNTHAQ